MSSRRLLKVSGFGRIISSQRTKTNMEPPIGQGSSECKQTHMDDKQTGTALESNPNKDTAMPFIVGHDKKKKEFYINITDGGIRRKESALLQYAWIQPTVVDLYHTEVPPAYRGQGIAKVLAKAAIDHFVSEDVKMKLSCTYLQKYARDHPVPSTLDSIYVGS